MAGLFSLVCDVTLRNSPTHTKQLGSHKLANTNDVFMKYTCNSGISVILIELYAVLYEKTLPCFHHTGRNCSSSSPDLSKYRMVHQAAVTYPNTGWRVR